MSLKGVDVSKHNGDLNFSLMKASGIQFAMVRAGYGKNNIDEKFHRNMEGFLDAGIEVGAYWFLYPLSVSDARKEADYFNEALSRYKGRIKFPIACDYEYDSENYARKQGVNPNKRFNTNVTKAFLERMQEHGWYVINYASIDFINNHLYNNELSMFDLWCAQWGTSICSMTCGMWQYADDGYVPGSSGKMDLNISYNDYPSIIASAGLNGLSKDLNIGSVKTIDEIANEVLEGIWGIGEDRVNRITAAGYDYNVVQDRVNKLCSQDGKAKDDEQIVQEVLKGLWGNGEERRQRLAAAGYNYEKIQSKVNKAFKKKGV